MIGEEFYRGLSCIRNLPFNSFAEVTNGNGSSFVSIARVFDEHGKRETHTCHIYVYVCVTFLTKDRRESYEAYTVVLENSRDVRCENTTVVSVDAIQKDKGTR